MEIYNDLNEEKAEYLEKARRLLEGRETIKSVSVGSKSLVSLITEGIEESVSMFENGLITKAKEEHWKFLVMISNVARVDISYAQFIKGDIKKSLSRLYPKYAAMLHLLNPNDYEAAILVAADESRELIERYWQNPAKDAPKEMYDDAKTAQPKEETKSFWQKLKETMKYSGKEGNDDN